MLKQLRLPGTVLGSAVILLLSAGAQASASGTQQNFSASFSGAEQTSGASFTFTGSGFATHMGAISTAGQAVVEGPDITQCAGGIANVNTETLTSDEDGSSLTIRSHDVGCPIGPGQFHGHGHWSVTSGTGRFAGATGDGELDGYVDFVAGTFSFSASGGVFAPGS
jgi:hypothetical protein